MTLRLPARFGPVAALHRLGTGARQAGISLLAAFAAFTPAHLIGLNQAFWGAITAIAVSQATFREAESTARKQVIGAVIGGVTALCLIELCGQGLGIYAIAVVLAILLCWLLDVGDSSQLAGITATIVLLVPHIGSAEAMMAARLSEVTWGVVVGISIVWLEERIFRTAKATVKS